MVADVRVREDEDALGEGDLRLERDALGEIEQALVAEEAVFADVQPGEPAPVEVEEADVVQDRPAADPRAEQAQPRRAQLRHEQQPVGDHRDREPAEARRLAKADLRECLHRASRRSFAAEAQELPEVAQRVAHPAAPWRSCRRA